MKLPRPLGLTAIALATMLLAACGSTETGTATTPEENPAGTDTTQTSPSNSPSLAPPVEDPLDPEVLLSKPCDLLTDTQLDQLGLVQHEAWVDDLGDQQCTWEQATEDANAIHISNMGNIENGLDSIYAQRDQYEYFEPTTINGYPAVFAAHYSTPDSGTCGLHVGITDDLVARVSTQFLRGPEADNSCPVAQETAEAMIDTLKG